MNSEMVRAVLDGRKTQTRRLIKTQPKFLDGSWGWHNRKIFKKNIYVDCPSDTMNLFCPYGKGGDRLWVRETFQIVDFETGSVWYRANGDDKFWQKRFAEANEERILKCKKPTWVPSIHMPRWASRLTLEITNIRVERLNDISEEDAKAEGVQKMDSEHYKSFPWLGAMHPIKGYPKVFPNAVSAFKSIWEEIYGSWEANPWVWVIEFKKMC